VHAVSPGPRELGMWPLFRELAGRGTVPVVCSNVAVKSGNGEVPIGKKTEVITVNGVRLGLLALMGGGEFTHIRAQDGVNFAFSDPFQTAAEIVPKLASQSDVVILMSQMSTEDTNRLIQAVPGIDVALFGQRAAWQQSVRTSGQTIISEAGVRGQYAGRLVLIVDPQGEIVEHGSMNAALDKAFPEDSTIVAEIAELNKQVAEMRKSAREQSQSSFEQNLSGERFLGVDMCRRCHERQYQQWASTPHAHAFATLDRPLAGKPKTTACTNCHVTGFGESGGFAPDGSRPDFRPTMKPDLVNVQCEACHGKGTEHQRTGVAKVSEATCRSCHTPEWSPDFNFATAVQSVKH